MMAASSTEQVIAVATIVLAGVTLLLVLVTALLVWATRRSAHDAREDARSALAAAQATTARELEAARHQLEHSYRPLLIEVLPTGPVLPDMGASANGGATGNPRIALTLPGRATEEIDPREVLVRLEQGTAYVSVPLRNVGRGLAVIDAGGIGLTGEALGAQRYGNARRTRVPVGETTRVDVICAYATGTPMTPEGALRLTVPYTDFAGSQHTNAQVQLSCERDPTGAWYVTNVEQE